MLQEKIGEDLSFNMLGFGFSFNKIFVLKSLGESDTFADDLYYNTIVPSCENVGLVKELIELYDKSDWDKAIEKICQDKLSHPLIHFEMHGDDKKGLKLRLGDYIPWAKVIDDLRRINVRSGFNLVITMATCYSTFLAYHIAMVKKPAPYLISITANKKVLPDVTYAMYSIFFKELIRTSDLHGALKKVEKEYPCIPTQFALITVPFLFEDAWTGIAKLYEKKEDVVRHFYHILPEVQDRELLREEFESYKEGFVYNCTPENLNRYYQRCRDEFFMYDCFPENRKRFSPIDTIC